MSRITGSTGSIQHTQQVQPNEVVTDNKDPDKLNNVVQEQGAQPSLSGEAKGMLNLGGELVKRSLEGALKTGELAQTAESQTASAALGYGGKLGLADNNTEQPAASTALGYGGKLGILPEE
jgi:hypothetical protein